MKHEWLPGQQIREWEAFFAGTDIFQPNEKGVQRLIADWREMRYILRGLIDPKASMDYSIEALELGQAMLDATADD